MVGKDRSEIRITQMIPHNLAAKITEVGRDLQISAGDQIPGGKTGPVGQHLTAIDRAADCHHGRATSVVGAARAVLGNRAPEFAHGQDADLVHLATQILIESSQAVGNIVWSLDWRRGAALLDAWYAVHGDDEKPLQSLFTALASAGDDLCGNQNFTARSC